ncbi:uncharacterized protein LOC100874793 [Megachile rotundata]|uniref:uncharacterized protein LOC100874793 n=1 Tax=Megachile rotundata TaxID=143995 RepID=UPI000258F0DF|nr:PREDICTED: uncharacterized protein LOC100874793 [Megachile rotundata]XP_012149591.1 PREDICTED: uncharacterized protein LOC100874793 [Megachile rotundata]
METEEIYSFAISPPILSIFAIQWSQDNHISILTEKGIHIFELIPSPMSPYSNIKFSRSFVYPPSIFPAQVITGKIESKIWNMQREDVYSCLMEESLTPKMSNVKEMVPKIINLAWSPQNLIHPSKCLLAILTSAGTAMIIYKISMEWYPAHDLSSIRYNAVEKEINTENISSKQNSNQSITLKNNIKALLASCFTWSELFINFAYLTVAYRNGDITIYKIPRILNYNEIPNPEIVGTMKSKESVKINVMHWISINAEEHLIIIAYLDGRIYGLKVQNHNHILEMKFIHKYYDYKDRIVISAIKIFPQNDSCMKVLVSKGTFLLLLCLSLEGKLEILKHLQLKGFTISGAVCISSHNALVTTENGSMFTIDTRENNLSKMEVNNRISQIHARYLGLTHSLNRVIFVNLTMPDTIYDHLVIKEPSKICMFGLKGKQWNPLLVLKNSEHERFEQLWDCLEVLRIKAIKASEPTSIFPELPSDLKSLSLKELQISMWISVMMEICEKKKVIEGVGSIAGEISEAQPLIFVHTAYNYLMYFVNKSTLLQEQQISINLLRKYLEMYLAEEANENASPFYERIRSILKKTSQFKLDNIESCSLCGETINDLPWKVNKCPQGHILPRCAITLLQITSAHYSTCPICGLIFHSAVDEVFKETRCLFCDVAALQENRILNSKYCVPVKKSLSTWNNKMEVSEEQEVEIIAEETV